MFNDIESKGRHKKGGKKGHKKGGHKK